RRAGKPREQPPEYSRDTNLSEGIKMPLDPQIAAALTLLEGLPPMETMPLDALRASMSYPPLEQRTAVAQVRDVEIACAAHVIPARLYRPIEQKYSGLIVYFHGGGFVIGSIETHDHVCRDLCAHSGAAVLSV